MGIRLKNPTDFNIMMIKNGFTQRSLGKSANVSDTTINHLLTGKRFCGPQVAFKICEAMKVSFDDIFFIVDADKSNLQADKNKAVGECQS
ncbi:MAG: helix-turn-helix transcriptional regulator [Desulfuromonadaceae bacterium]